MRYQEISVPLLLRTPDFEIPEGYGEFESGDGEIR